LNIDLIKKLYKLKSNRKQRESRRLMDFILQREFFHPHVNTKMKRKNAADNVIYTDKTKCTSYLGFHIKLCVCPSGTIPLRGPLQRAFILLEEKEHGIEVLGG
jgi:hypothetical protein